MQPAAVSVVPLSEMHTGMLAGVDTVLVVGYLGQPEGVKTNVGYVIVVD